MGNYEVRQGMNINGWQDVWNEGPVLCWHVLNPSISPNSGT